MTELPDAHLDATVPAVRRFPLPVLHPADATPLARRASDASAAVHPDEAVDAVIRALAAAPCAEKLAVPAPAVPVSDGQLPLAQALPVEAKVPCTPDADRSVA